MSALCQKRTHAVQHKTDKWSPRLIVDPPLAVGQLPSVSIFIRLHVAGMDVVSAFDVAVLASMSWGRRHGSQQSNWTPRAEILKILQGLGEGVVAVDRGPVETLAPEQDSRGARRKHRSSQCCIWPAFLDQLWIGRLGDDPRPSRSPKMRHDGSRRT